MNGTKTDKILFIINSSSFFLSHRRSLVDACAGKFETVILLPKSPLNQEIRDLGFNVKEYPISRAGRNPFFEMKTFYSIFKWIRQEQPNICHTFTVKPILYGGIAARLLKVPHVFSTITGLGYLFTYSKNRSFILRCLVKILYRLSLSSKRSKIIFQNHDDLKIVSKFANLSESQCFVVKGSGVDPKKFYPIQSTSENQQDSITVLVPCRMLWDKGVGDIVKAFSLLKSPVPAQLLLAGDLDPENPSRISKKQLPQASNIEWLGRVKDMNSLYNKVDIVCLPSYREGLPLALLEASLCKKPLISTDSPGCRELVKHRENGLLVPVKSPKKLLEAVITLINEPTLRVQLGETAYQIALDEYVVSKINRRILDLYDKCFPSYSEAP